MIDRRNLLTLAVFTFTSAALNPRARAVADFTLNESQNDKKEAEESVPKSQSLTAAQQEQLRAVSARIKALPPHRREQFRAYLNRWRAMTPPQREKLRNRWRRFRALPSPQQTKLRRRYDRWRKLSLEQQQALELAIKRRQGS